MTQGRCAGCGRIDSLRKSGQHIVNCPEYLELYRQEPERCLAPADEFVRFKAEDNSPIARAQHRGTRLSARFAEINRRHAASVARWQRPPDILDG